MNRPPSGRTEDEAVRGRYLADDARGEGRAEGLRDAARLLERRARDASDPAVKQALDAARADLLERAGSP